MGEQRDGCGPHQAAPGRVAIERRLRRPPRRSPTGTAVSSVAPGAAPAVAAGAAPGAHADRWR